jgi:hypothetical protein
MVRAYSSILAWVSGEIAQDETSNTASPAERSLITFIGFIVDLPVSQLVSKLVLVQSKQLLNNLRSGGRKNQGRIYSGPSIGKDNSFDN